eukprot:TRINITY_DN328_c0_g2_i1.p3 TRINITY_DN328_c0_g2~~TRINITY_DN328_c0_g2_i1.p3  ORF type:complete len:137 (+),score=23.63 TRINITY_DN328_c0_g2_i1:59-469(+)
MILLTANSYTQFQINLLIFQHKQQKITKMVAGVTCAAPTLPVRAKLARVVTPRVLRAPTSTHSMFREQTKLARTNLKGTRKSALQAVSYQEVAQLAGEAGMIAGTAAVMFAITLVGLALGFVLLRVEALVEEGKLP